MTEGVNSNLQFYSCCLNLSVSQHYLRVHNGNKSSLFANPDAGVHDNMSYYVILYLVFYTFYYNLYIICCIM